MGTSPSLTDILLAAACTAPGALIVLGVLLALAVFLVPLLLPETHGWREVERRVIVSDWGLSAAAVLIALGLSGLLFLFAGRRVYSRFTS